MKRMFSLLLIALFVYSFSATGQYRRIVTIAGKGGTGAFTGDGFTATNAFFHAPTAVALDSSLNAYIVDNLNYRIRKVFRSTTQVITYAGTGSSGWNGDGSLSTSADMAPTGVAADRKGNLFISDAAHSVIRKVNKLGIISTICGRNVTWGNTGDGGPATRALLAAPQGLCVDRGGNLFICDAANNAVRMIDTLGVITTIAGDFTRGFSGDGGPATAAQLDSPYAVAVDRFGDVFIADHNNSVIRMVDAATQTIVTIAGIPGSFGYSGDGGLATYAELNHPCGVAVDTSLNVYISDADNNVIRKIDATSGIINNWVGNSYPGFGGDLGDPLGANLFHPQGIAIDSANTIYIADANNQRVRKVYFTTVGVDDVTKTNGIDVYPNPVENEINLSGLEKNDVVCIYDIVGKSIAKWTSSVAGEQTFSVAGLQPGMYTLQVTDKEGNRKTTVKIVK